MGEKREEADFDFESVNLCHLRAAGPGGIADGGVLDGKLDTAGAQRESERAVQAALDELMKGRTTICIAHRLSTILHADEIVVLDQGRIVETGTHTELVRRGGIYQKLYELQFSS